MLVVLGRMEVIVETWNKLSTRNKQPELSQKEQLLKMKTGR
jgi:hypothetical protein